MNILVIGGAGYIGAQATKQLIEDGYTVSVLDNLCTGHRKAVNCKAKFYVGDIKDTLLLSKILIEDNIEAVMHFAAYSIVPESFKIPLDYYDNNVTGMISLLRAMDFCKVKYLIFSSSAATYGIPIKLPITESTPLVPINPYGETKMMMEKIMMWADKSNGIKSVALRYFNVAGAAIDSSIGEDHLEETHLIPNILKSVINDSYELTIFGNDYDTEDGTNIRDYIHVEDLVDAHILALKYLEKTQTSDIFNLGTTHGYSNLEILHSATKVIGKKIPYTIGDRRKGDPDALVADSTKARKVLNWKPRHENIDDLIATAWKWHKTHPQGFLDK